MTEEDQIAYALKQSLGGDGEASDYEDSMQHLEEDVSSDNIYGVESDDGFEEFDGYDEDSDVEIIEDLTHKGKSVTTSASTAKTAIQVDQKEEEIPSTEDRKSVV